jgi:hypothetical protein
MSRIKSKQIKDFTADVRSSFTAGDNVTISNGIISAAGDVISANRPIIYDKTANYTITTPASSLLQEIYTVSGASAVTITLPNATLCASMEYHIKRLGTGTVTVNTTSSQTIDGLTSIVISSQYANLTVISDGSNWIII